MPRMVAPEYIRRPISPQKNYSSTVYVKGASRLGLHREHCRSLGKTHSDREGQTSVPGQGGLSVGWAKYINGIGVTNRMFVMIILKPLLETFFVETVIVFL